MDDPDFLMGDDTVVGSTELNGDDQTVDPSVFAMGTPTIDTSPRKEQLPILSYPDNTAVTSFASLHEDQTAATGDDVLFDTNSSSSQPETSDSSMESAAPVEAQVLIPPPPRSTALPRATLRSGLVYDLRMKFHMPMQEHPEEPRRISAIWETLYKAGLVEWNTDNEPDPEAIDKLWNIEIRPATKEEVLLVHSKEHWKWVKNLRKRSPQELSDLSDKLDSAYVNESTFQAACLAAGGAIEACRAVVLDTGGVKNAIAVIRPPGHHAEHDEASGFCIFNNVSIAAKVCRANFPATCRKILILDWDVHHGNGIQHAFYDDPNVLYISIHVYKNGLFYPNGPDGDHLHCGEGDGEGKNINIPWANVGMGDFDYLYAFEEVVIPIAREFDPDLIIVAAGFDAAEGDDLGQCHVTPPGYAVMTHKLMELANGKIVVCLEGGYNLDSISKSALAVTKTLMGETPDRLPVDPYSDIKAQASNLGVATVEMVKKHQSKYWRCMRQRNVNAPQLTPYSVQMHELVKSWRNMTYSKSCGMEPFVINRAFLSESFEGNLLVSENFDDGTGRPLLVIFHDPPGYDVVRDPTSIRTEDELHNSWLTDGTKTYVDWAHNNEFAIIDINVPKVMINWPDEGDSERAHSLLVEHKGEYIPPSSSERRTIATREVAKYLWESYIEMGQHRDVFLMGVGEVSVGLVDFLGVEERVNSEDSPLRYVITFLSRSPLASIKRSTDDYIGAWYYQHSRVFVSEAHHVWEYKERKGGRGLRKKYGNVKPSNFDTIGRMLEEAKDEVIDLFLEETEGWRTEQAEKAKAVTKALKLEERDMRASSVPNPLRSPSGMPPIGMFSVSSSTPRSPAKRP